MKLQVTCPLDDEPVVNVTARTFRGGGEYEVTSTACAHSLEEIANAVGFSDTVWEEYDNRLQEGWDREMDNRLDRMRDK